MAYGSCGQITKTGKLANFRWLSREGASGEVTVNERACREVGGQQSPPLLWQQICQQGVSAVGAGGHCRWNLFIYSSDVLPPVYRINVIIQDRAWCDFPYSMTCARKKCYRQKSDFGSFRWKKSRRRKTENSPRSSLCCLHGWKKLACVEKVWFITKSLGFNNLIKKFV